MTEDLRQFVVFTDAGDMVQTLSFLLIEAGMQCHLVQEVDYSHLLSLALRKTSLSIACKTEWYFTYGISLAKQLQQRGKQVKTNSDFPDLRDLISGVDDEATHLVSIDRLVYLLLRSGGANSLNLLAIRDILAYHGGSRPHQDVPLSQTEQKELKELTRGKSYKMIANSLEVSIETVKSHLKAIYRKLGVNNSTSAVALAYQDGLI